MRKLVLLMLLVGVIGMSYDVHVNGYYRSNGTYVESYHRSSPDGYKWNNYNQD